MEIYLEHHGVKGQRWGIRRYQNLDGTLTRAGKKRLAKEVKRDYKRGRYSEELGDVINKAITDDDRKRISSVYREMLPKFKEGEEAEKSLFELAEKYGREYYDVELRRNPSAYNTSKSRRELELSAKFEYGYVKARETRPDLVKIKDTADKYLDEYNKECRSVSDRLLGKYGDTKLYKAKGYSSSVKDAVDGMLTSMAKNNWKYK